MNNIRNQINIPILVNSSHYIENSNEYRYQMKKPLSLTPNSRISFLSSSFYNSFFNITQSFGNNVFQIKIKSESGLNINNISSKYKAVLSNGWIYLTITLEDGYYTFEQLNLFLQSIQIQIGLYLTGVAETENFGSNYYFLEILENVSLYGVQIISRPIIAKTGFQVGVSSSGTINLTLSSNSYCPNIYFYTSSSYLPYGSFGSILGFSDNTNAINESLLHTSTIQTNISTKSPNLNPISAIVIGTNLINNYITFPSDYLGQIPITNQFGSLMSYTQTNTIYYNTINGNINNLSIYIYDQKGNPLIPKDPDNTFSILYTEFN